MDFISRQFLRQIIFEAETPHGRLFDVGLLLTIVLSTLCVTLESFSSINHRFAVHLDAAEWFFTIAFSIEYLLRVYCSEKPVRYIFSFYGLVDLIAIVPSYLMLFLSGAESFLMVRSLRLIRVFRVLKLVQFVGEGRVLIEALAASRRKITVFMVSVSILVIIIGTMMYLIEGPENGFSNIPVSVYWAIVTMTTVGYGDIAPQTPFGKLVASVVMMLGYCIIAIPTGIVSVGIAQSSKRALNTRLCPHCNYEGHSIEAKYCLMCGGKLDPI